VSEYSLSHVFQEQEKNQAVIELDMDVWREAIRIFRIESSAIPHRTYREDQLAGNRWYS